MEKLGDYVKQSVLNFKLELCCFMASVRTGILILACADIILGFITQVVLADKTFDPILLRALNGLYGTEDPPDDKFRAPCIIAYAVELASNSLLLCGIIRNDLVLLRVYLYYAFGVITAAVMVYSVVFFSLSIGCEILILASVLYQLYMILLVRSVMIEIKEQSIKNGYVVNLKRNDIEGPSGPGPRETYSIVIEPEKVKKTPITIVKEDSRKPIGKETVKPDLNKEATLPVHLATREVIVKPVPVKEVAVPVPVKEVVVPVPVKVVTVPIHESKGTKAEVKEVAKEKEVKKPSRSFFGKKEKVKIEDNKGKLEKIEEAKKD